MTVCTAPWAKRAAFAFGCAALLALSPSPAHAYVDPGVGSILLQGLAAAFFSAMVFWNAFRKRLTSLFFKKDKDSSVEEDNTENKA